MLRRQFFLTTLLAPFSALIAKNKPAPTPLTATAVRVLEPPNILWVYNIEPKVLVCSTPSGSKPWIQERYIQIYKDLGYEIKHTTNSDFNGLEVAKIFNEELI